MVTNMFVDQFGGPAIPFTPSLRRTAVRWAAGKVDKWVLDKLAGAMCNVLDAILPGDLLKDMLPSLPSTAQ